MISESNLNRYRLFCAVAECESISRAAEINYISQPAISKAITKMEESLGTQLFVRNHRGVTLTDEGRLLYEQLKTAFDIIHEGEDKLRRINELGIGRLRLGASAILCKHMLLPYLKGYIEENPHVKITVDCQSSSKLIKQLADGRIDIALMVKPENLSDIGFYSLGEIEDVFDGENASRMHVDRYFAENGIVPEHILEVSGMDMLIEFVKTGIGAACVIKSFVEKELEEGSLVEIPLTVPINKREVGFAYMKNAKPAPAVERFMNFYENYPS